MPDFTIRRLNQADIEEFWNLRLKALKEEPSAFGKSFEEAAKIDIGQATERLKESSDAFVLGAFTGSPQLAERDRLVGILGFFRRTGIKLRHKGIIWGVYVHPSNRGQGLARSLMQKAVAEAKEMDGLEEIQLTVVSQNTAAIELYKSLGFFSYGLERHALKWQAEYFDEELLCLPL